MEFKNGQKVYVCKFNISIQDGMPVIDVDIVDGILNDVRGSQKYYFVDTDNGIEVVDRTFIFHTTNEAFKFIRSYANGVIKDIEMEMHDLEEHIKLTLK